MNASMRAFENLISTHLPYLLTPSVQLWYSSVLGLRGAYLLATTSHFARIRAKAVTLYQPLNLLMPHAQPKRPGCQKGAEREPYAITMIWYDIFCLDLPYINKLLIRTLLPNPNKRAHALAQIQRAMKARWFEQYKQGTYLCCSINTLRIGNADIGIRSNANHYRSKQQQRIR